jgi:2-amino-4-hydroxy-6-hydroxymethyldihydropteridine diphosphokinase
MNEAILALGSNINPEDNIHKAKRILFTTFNVLAVSKFTSTRPVGPAKQPDFINGAVFLRTNLELNQLKEKLKRIEKDLGRIHTNDKFAPRTIDLDIVVWNKELIDHDFYTRDYLRSAVLELMPDLKYEHTSKR